MKEFLLLFTTIELIILISGVPDRCGNGVKYSYPGDHTKFIVCENHIPIAKKCPIGTTFNQNVQVCDSISSSDSNSGNINVASGSYHSPSTSTITTYKKIDQNSGTYGSPNYNGQSANQNGFEGNNLDQSLGTGHNNQHLAVSQTGQSVNEGYSQGQGQYTRQQSTSRIQSGYIGATVPSNQLGSYGQSTHSDNGIAPNSNHNQHYAGTSNSGYHVVTASHSTSTLPLSGYNSAASDRVYTNQGHEAGYNSRTHTGIKNHQHHSDSGGSYNDYKNINSDNGLWLQNQNHGLDQNHINLNEIRGSTGHGTNSCNKVAPGEHIAYPSDCTKFIVCMEDGKHVVKNCPPKTHFNPQLQICDWPDSAGCIY